MRSRSARASDTSPSIVDHDSGRLVWAAAGRDKQTVTRFLDLLGQTSAASGSSSCPATWPAGSPGRSHERCPNATVCYDPFHLIKLATDALDDIRREVWNEARRAGHRQLAAELKGARFALWKNPGNLTEPQQLKLARDPAAQPAAVPRLPARPAAPPDLPRPRLDQAIGLLDAWLRWARRCRLEPFVKLARTITEQRDGDRGRASRTDSRTSAFHTAPPGEVVVVMPSVTGLR